tara:strand:- start:202 stop:381 length:180 start_codon:yes stop_codon:yes gene_type:complete
MVICKAVRPSTGSTIEVELPTEIVKAVEDQSSPTPAVEWIGNEFNWQFIPASFKIAQEN